MKKVTTPALVFAVSTLLIVIVALSASLFQTNHHRDQRVTPMLSTSAQSAPLARRAPSPGVTHPEHNVFPQPAIANSHGQLLLIGAIDSSASWRKAGLGKSIIAAAKLSSQLDPNKDRLTLYRVDERLNEFYDQAPLSRKEAMLTIARHVGRTSAYSGTYPAAYWREVARRALQEQGLIIICLWSDGDNDDMAASSRLVIQQAAQKLASNPRVIGVFVLGAKGTEENWAALRRDLGALGNRLHLVPDSRLHDVSQITSLIDNSRS